MNHSEKSRKKEIEVARKLIRLASTILKASPPSATFSEFEDYKNNDEYGNADDFPWTLFETKEELEEFRNNNAKTFPHLKEIISTETMQKLFDEGWFCIVSAGVNPIEDEECRKKSLKQDGTININEYKRLKHLIVDKRYEKLCEFLETLNVTYYEVVGQYDATAEKSYVVDLTDTGKNNKYQAKLLFKKICSFCGNELRQESIVEGIGKKRAIVYCNDRSHRKYIDDNGDKSFARTQLFHNIEDRKQNTTVSDNYGNWTDDEIIHSDWLDDI